MGLIFTGNQGYNVSGVPKWQDSTWDLDSLVIPYRGPYTGLEAFIASHTIGEASPIDSNMFLMLKPNDEHKQFPTAFLTYQGKHGGALPPIKHETDRDRLSASSKRGASIQSTLAQPLILEFYAPTKIITYYSRDAEGTTEADDPTDDPEIISVTCMDQTFVVGPVLLNTIAGYFSTEIIKSFHSIEVVPGHYWQNTSKKTKQFVPLLFEAPAPGPFITLYSPGTGYVVGDTLTLSFQGQTAILSVTQVLVAWGGSGDAGVYAWTVGVNTFTQPVTALPATGGTGTGVAFNVQIIP